MKSYELTWLAASTLLAALAWVPHVLHRIGTHGLFVAMGKSIDRLTPEPGSWPDRAQRAHTNSIENLAVFAPLLLSVVVAGLTSPGTLLAAQIYFFARLGHYVVYVLGVPVMRTLLFFVGLGCQVFLAGKFL